MAVQVILYDGNKEKNEAELREQLGNPSDLTIVLGELTDEVLAQAGLCVISPGIPTDADFAHGRYARQVFPSGVRSRWLIITQRDLSSIAITGTNGIVRRRLPLTGKICADYAESVFVVGNIGNAYTKEALKTKEESITVAEVSSFQLENIVKFHPQVSAVLNITPDHLNRHKTMECYTNVKRASQRISRRRMW